MKIGSIEGVSYERQGDEVSKYFEQLGAPTAESASRALRLAVLTGENVDQRAVHFIKTALLTDKDGVRDQMRAELLAASDALFDRVGATLLHVNAELFSKDVMQLYAQGSGLGQSLVASALSAVAANDEVIKAVLEVLHDPEIRKLNVDCLTKSYRCLLGLLTGVFGTEEVRKSLLALVALPERYVSAGALEILSGAIKNPVVAQHFVKVVLSNRDVERPIDSIRLLLEAPPIEDVIVCLAANIYNAKHRERILERAGEYPHLRPVRKMLITVASAAAWGTDTYTYSFSAFMRGRAIEVIDQQLRSGEPNGDQVAEDLVARLSDPSSTILNLVRERMSIRSIQQALIRALADKERTKASWCAKVLMEVCDQPDVRGLLLPLALDWTAGSRNLALEVLSGKHCSTLQEPRDRIGNRRPREAARMQSGDYRWEG